MPSAFPSLALGWYGDTAPKACTREDRFASKEHEAQNRFHAFLATDNRSAVRKRDPNSASTLWWLSAPHERLLDGGQHVCVGKLMGIIGMNQHPASGTCPWLTRSKAAVSAPRHAAPVCSERNGCRSCRAREPIGFPLSKAIESPKPELFLGPHAHQRNLLGL